MRPYTAAYTLTDSRLSLSAHSPRRTIATAQVLYHRFHLFFPLKDVAVQDVSVACLLVSSKLEDTLKKLRDIQIAAFQVRAAHEGLQQGALAEPDPAALEADRAKLIGVERLILETISFNFNLRSNAAYATRHATSSASQNQDTFAYVVKLGKAMRGACAHCSLDFSSVRALAELRL